MAFIVECRNLRNQILPWHIINVIVIKGIMKVLFTAAKIWRKKMVLHLPTTIEGKFKVGLWSSSGETVMDSQ